MRLKRQPDCHEQLTELLLGALAPAGENEHLQIEELSRRKIAAGLNHAVNHQELAAGIYSAAAGFEQLQTLVVRPIVDDVFHDVGIGACRN